VAWAVLPPVLLFAVSQVLPLWDVHYLLFSLPGLTLLLAGLVPAWTVAPACERRARSGPRCC
jgi:hypothetical protein